MMCTMRTLPGVRTSRDCKKKKNLYTSSCQLRANQAPDPPWEGRLIYTDQIDVIDL